MEIREAELRKIDLNLLLAFVVLMRERNVSRAARKLFIGQPGMSGALNRLRELFRDELLVRAGRSLEPTPRALELLGPVESALAALQQAVLEPSAFEPATAEGTVRLGMPDGHELTFLPAIVRKLERQAPRLLLAVRPVDRLTAGPMLDASEIDLALSVFPAAEKRYETEHLFEQGFSCVYSPQRLRVRTPVGLDDFCRYPHLLVSYAGDFSGAIDDALARVGRRRQVRIVTSRFSTVPFLLKETAAFATMPAQVASRLARAFRLAVSPPPVPVASNTVRLVWKRKDHGNQRHHWLRTLVRDAVQEELAR